jgi:hypothetical protein
MVSAPTDDLKNTKIEDISQVDTKLFKLNALKTKLINCLTPAFGYDIKELMPEETSNKYGHIYFFSEKEAHQRHAYPTLKKQISTKQKR